MRHYIILLLFIFSFHCCLQDGSGDQNSKSGFRPDHLTCKYLTNPPVIDIEKPRLGWVNIPDQDIRGQAQTAWQVRVASSTGKLENPDLWDSGKVEGNQPMFGGGITWLYRILAGMTADPEQPGYRHIIFRPQPAENIILI